jgi:HK97 gp10 family phage protein
MAERIDASEVHDLQQLIGHAAGATPAEARKVLQKGLLNIKADSRRRISGSRHFRRVAAAITYESHETRTGGWGEVGPEQDRPQGNLAWIPEHGSLKTPPQPFMRPAAAAEQPRFEKAMQDLAEKATGL